MFSSQSRPTVLVLHPFVHRMILRNAINAALQRACVYTDTADFASRRHFREHAKDWLLNFGRRYDYSSVTEITWCSDIEELASTLSAEFSVSLRDGRLTFGVSQKMVSLYLKYHWLLGDFRKKPLFAVVDRGIMKAANIRPLLRFPTLTKADYLKVVHAIDAFAKKQLDDSNQLYGDGAAWEAAFWTDAFSSEES